MNEKDQIQNLGRFSSHIRILLSSFTEILACVLMAWFFFEGISIPIVTKYRHQLKLSKKHKTDDNISVPRRIVSKNSSFAVIFVIFKFFKFILIGFTSEEKNSREQWCIQAPFNG